MPAPHLTDEQLSAHLDRALAEDESASVQSHLEDCAECAARRDLLRATSQAVADLPGEDLPRPLDLTFLRQAREQRTGAAASRGFVARVIHGRPPVWLPTAVAAAAVLILAVTIAPRFLPGGGASRGTTAGQEALTAPKGATAPTQGNGSGAAPGLDGSARKPNSNFVAPRDALARKSVTAPDGSTVSIVASPPEAPSGLPTLVVVKVVAGPTGTALAPQGVDLFIGQGSRQARLATSAGGSPRLKPGEEIDVSGQWSAGALDGQPTPGTYTVTGRVYLADGEVVEVTLPYVVAGA
ncbi:MAG TPA: zf-HC2 domain-containing protein [Candidatus Dormibacteraeota bacterium]|nr:zf-HC2 domain-containing protein [Candidatus Dormibacteraeota bacterium]